MSDLISRQAEIDAIVERTHMDWESLKILYPMLEVIDNLPSAEPKKGKWIPCTKQGMPLTELGRMEGEKWYGYKCSNCNFIYKGNALLECDYCQHCGADMRKSD